MSKPLPPRPNLEQLKKQAKAILKGYKEAVPEIVGRFRGYHPRWTESTRSRFTLSDAQTVIAREHGFDSWSKLKEHVLRQEGKDSNRAAEVKSFLQAAGRGDLATLNSLLDGDPGLINEAGGPGVRTALHQAVFGNQEAAVKLLLDRGADPNVRCEGDNAYPLHFAAEKQRIAIIRLLIEREADPVGEGDYHELDVIGWATAWDYCNPDREVVDYLLTHGARHNIFSAVAVGDTQAIRQLVSLSSSCLERRMDLVNRRRRPLHLAVIKKQPQSLMTLLDLGANTESLDEAGFTALDQAALTGDVEMVQALINRGAKIRLPAAFALQRARDIGTLLRKDPDALKPGGRWGNLIIRASERAPGAIIEALIKAGASIDVPDDPKTSVDTTFGYTPLHAAAFNGNISAAAVLLKHGANVQAREEKYHGTPAGWANYAGHSEIRDLILREPVDLIEAVEFRLTERVAHILEEDPSAVNRPFQEYRLFPLYAEGWHTPLAFAVAQGNTVMVEFLLDRGADRAVRSPDGQALWEIAQGQGNARIAEILMPNAP
jgi:ankyrin repeat protein